MHYSGWPGLAVFALIWSRYISRSYASSLLKSYRSRSFFTHSSYDFLGQTFFLFPVISSSITLRIWELMSRQIIMTDYRRRLCIIISTIFTTTKLPQRTSVDTLLTSLTPNIIMIIRRSTQRNLASSATVISHVSKHYNKTGLTQHW